MNEIGKRSRGNTGGNGLRKSDGKQKSQACQLRVDISLSCKDTHGQTAVVPDWKSEAGIRRAAASGKVAVSK